MVEGHVAKAVEVQVLSSAPLTEKNPRIEPGILFSSSVIAPWVRPFSIRHDQAAAGHGTLGFGQLRDIYGDCPIAPGNEPLPGLGEGKGENDSVANWKAVGCERLRRIDLEQIEACKMARVYPMGID